MDTPPPRRTGLAIFLLLLLSLLAGGALAWRQGWLAWPERFNPWAPLDPVAAPNMLTPLKLRRTQGDARQCFAALAASGVRYERAADRATAPGCVLRDAVLLRRGDRVALRTPTLLSCRAALSFAMWERHALQPAAEAWLGQPVAAIEHFGSYACRAVRTGEGELGAAAGSSRRLSRHASADALDVAGFIGRDGRRVSVRRDWENAASGGPGDAAPFLHAARNGACRFFDAVLSPDYNALHADHLHLEVGGWRSCR